ncbi:hypothetical protein [Azospirillum thermophilum]|uniref:hypothetical protein n=1 Tax=Azospirillum thermophilum TaxID=2202148 RepID=UPI00143D2B9B|nr:hypothetical protein [Azospirillum thermophilum]
MDASIGNSAVRGLTYKTGTFLTNLLAFSYLTGSALDGTGMSALITAYSYGSYVATDYLWDTLYPRSAEARTPQEVLEESAWRTTAKFVTYKAVNMPVMLGLSYYATGTGAGAVGLYAGLSVFKAGLFYANNMIWDYYDAYAGPARPAAPAAAAP